MNQIKGTPAIRFLELPNIESPKDAMWRTTGCDCCSKDVLRKVSWDEDDDGNPEILTKKDILDILTKFDEMKAIIDTEAIKLKELYKTL